MHGGIYIIGWVTHSSTDLQPQYCLKENGKKDGGDTVVIELDSSLCTVTHSKKCILITEIYLKLCHVLDKQENLQDLNYFPKLIVFVESVKSICELHLSSCIVHYFKAISFSSV